ncbi:jg19598 [Pararge aegeria aegeria]|uniref:Jg19598 protein n=1 Tax=Pararge aegeria aegeria TaxID=348720 RepID=A0A8S4R2Q9_9NEOP|nr:jg19598 [Pararge aegeria aegeria]
MDDGEILFSFGEVKFQTPAENYIQTKVKLGIFTFRFCSPSSRWLRPDPEAFWAALVDGMLDLGHAPIAYAQPALTVAHAAPVYQAAPVVHAAPVAIAAKAATSYSSFQRVIHPAVAHQVVAQPVVHAAPAVVAQPVVHAAPLTLSHAPIASYGHGWGQGW